ncbi:hypothetical protein QVD17_05953 [Tagetes erecta]|uniref:RING-type domain-containing protein n=1 Tax=Tagetes erecta TaxID=13708 RepID=A0AAD8LF84_TARER|nr:hypothetical protein QVD17_05953 [Tagetes erecta]
MIDQGNKNVYGNQLKFGNEMNQIETGVIPMYIPSGLIETIPPVDLISRKRSRDLCSFDQSDLSFSNGEFVNQIQMNNRKGIFTFLGEDISMQIYQQQFEIDRFIHQHTEKMRSEIEANRRINSMRLISVADEGMKRLKSKDDEIMKIGRLNRALEEKVKSLTVDNQIWQQMAETNEATANVLRRNLQQILTQIQQENDRGAMVDDDESCCGSNYDDDDGVEKNNNNKNKKGRWCRNCGKEEFGVLLLPCRHLCICTVCESSINVCPICKSFKNATLHVNINN